MSAGTLKAPGSAVAAPEPTGRSAGDHLAKAARVSRALVLPAIGVSFLLTQIPFVLTIYYSLHEWNLLRPGDTPFVGLDNYRTVLGSREFFSSLRATIFITGGSVLLSLLFGLALAMLLNRQFKGQGLARTLLITPVPGHAGGRGADLEVVVLRRERRECSTGCSRWSGSTGWHGTPTSRC
jgi:sorbitol/mannitol transport system permease protein